MLMSNAESINSELKNEKDNLIDCLPNRFSQDALKEKQISTKEKIFNFLINFKQVLLLLIFYSSSITNFSILNTIYTISGVIFSLLLLNQSEGASKFKYIVIIFNLVYACLILILKITIYSLDMANVASINNLITEHKELLINLGFKYLEDNDNTGKVFNTFMGDSLIIFGAVFYIVIKCLGKNKEESQVFDIMTINKSNYSKISNYFMFLISLVTLGITCANISFLTMFYSLLIHLGLFIWSIRRTSKYHNFIYYLLSCLFTFHILLTHTFNIYDLRKTYMIGSSPIKIVKWMGIMKMELKLEYFLDFFLHIASVCLCVILIRINMFYNQNVRNSFIEPEKEHKLGNNLTHNFWTQFKDLVVKYIFSPYFVLHFCRLSCIYWIWRYINFPTIGLVIWLFYSFYILKADSVKHLTFWLAWPCLMYSYNAFMLANIKYLLDDFITDDNREKMKHYALEKFDYPLIDFMFIQFTISIFAILMKVNSSSKRRSHVVEGLKENLLNEEIKEETNTKSGLSFGDLIVKLIITNIDKITLIFMYFGALQQINISHFILTTIFLVQLILPNLIKKICTLIIICISLIFTLEYIFDYLKIYLDLTPDFVTFLNIFIEFDSTKKTIEIFLPFIIYCFYIQFQNYNSIVYKKYDSNEINFDNYINQLLKNYPKFKSFILFSVSFLQEIYIWVVLILLFCCIVAFENYFLFSCKLVIFFIIMYKFLNMGNKYKKNQEILKYVWTLVIFCGLNTILVYFYQFTILDYFSTWWADLEKHFPDWIRLNLEILGFEKYTKEEMLVELIPHYGSNFLSVLLLWELRRILNLKKEFNDTENKLSLNKEMISTSENEKVTNVNYFKYYSFLFLIFLCKTYWLFVFLSICAFLTTYQLSVTMVIYIIIFSLSYILMFNNLVKSINNFLNRSNKFFISRLIRYSIVEKEKNRKVLSKYRKQTFKILLAFGMTYIFLTYIYAIFADIQKNDPLIDSQSENYVKSISYLVGVYHDNAKKVNFLDSILGHIIMILLISLDLYVHKFQKWMNTQIEDLKSKIKHNEYIENRNKLKKQKLGSKNPSNLLPEEENLGSYKSAISFSDNVSERKSSIHLTIEPKNTFTNSVQNLGFDLTSIPILNRFLKVFEHYEINSKKEDYYRLRRPNSKNIGLKFEITIKKFLEEIICFLVLLSAIIKLNIFSIIYVLVVFYVQIKGKTISRIFGISKIVSCLIILQTIIFLSNLSINTDPRPNKEMLDLLSNTLNVPWYPSEVNDNWGFFLGLGVNYYQIKTLWVEFFVIIICFIYMDNFTYSIYESGAQDTTRVNYYLLRHKKSVRKSILNISEEEFEEMRQNLKLNFDINIDSLVDLKAKIFDGNKTQIDDSKLNNTIMTDTKTEKNKNKQKKKKKSRCHTTLNWFKRTTYLTLHNFILVVTLILSMMNTGLISTFYTVYSLYYLYTSNNIVLAKVYSLPKSLDKFLRIFFLVDLLLQLLYQNPLNVYVKDYDYILKSIGINKTIDFDKGPDSDLFNLNSSILAILKALMYFFVSLQVMIYSSSGFRDFYIGFILNKKETMFRSSIINSFLFNNKRIKMMERTMNNRKAIDKVLNELELQLEKWNNKLSGEKEKETKNELQEDSIKHEETLNIQNQIEEDLHKDESEIKNHIKEKIYNSLLVKMSILIYRSTTNYSLIEKENKQELENAIVRGQTYIKSTIEKKIDKFVEELDIEDIQVKELDVILDHEEEAVEKVNQENKSNEGEEEVVTNKNNQPQSIDKKLKTKSSIDKIDLNKYQKVLHDNLFVKYLTKSYMISFILWSIGKYLMDNFQYICFFFMFLNNFLYTSLISLFWPFAIFTFGLIEYPRPSYKFWKVCRIYSSIIIVIKCVIQFDFIKNIASLKSAFTLLNKYKIGLQIYDSTYSEGFVYYILFDAILIFFLMMQEYILIARGLWNNTEPELESMEDAYDRVSKGKTVTDSAIKDYTEDVLSLRKTNTRASQIETRKTFSERVFPQIRNNKPGKDFYAFYTIIEMVLIIFIIFFYTDMDQDNMFKLSGTSKIRQFSGTMVLIAFFHAIKAVFDRIIYVKQNRNKLEFEYVYYNKQTGEKLSQDELKEMGIASPKDIDRHNSNVEYYYIQKETVNYPLIMKYLLQVVITIFSHFFIFFFLPMVGNKNLQNSIYCEVPTSCNDFSYNLYLKIFYVLYSLYLFFSALQIHFGLLDMRNKSLLMRGDNIIYSSCFKVYNAIPFLYELKLTIDWTFTPTCLDLFKWLKFESVYNLLFVTHCTKKSEMKVPIGNNISPIQKALMGGSSFVILLLILLGPLLIFSTLNPTNVINNVTGADIELSICFQQGKRVFNNFTLFKNDYVDSIQEMSEGDNLEIWKTYGYQNSSQTKNFPTSQVQIIRMSETSDTIWDIAGPHIETIKDRLENYRNYSYNIYLGFQYNFNRPSPPEARDSVKKFDYPLYIPGKVDKAEYIKILIDNIKYCNKTDLVIDNFYNPALRLTSQSHPKVIWDNANFLNETISTKFVCDYNNGDIDYTKSYHMLSKVDTRDPTPNIVFHTFSDKVSTTSTAYDVVTFYISFIIVIGRVIRGVVSGEAEKIVLTEMPEPNSLVNLCEGIKISRYRFEFDREEHLYHLLIDFMRSPEILKLLTKSSLKKLQERKEIHSHK